jgi:hypothetical protein
MEEQPTLNGGSNGKIMGTYGERILTLNGDFNEKTIRKYGNKHYK